MIEIEILNTLVTSVNDVLNLFLGDELPNPADYVIGQYSTYFTE
ncbi:MAG: hypothetical protein QF432_04395 [Dehalococcoidales bacterium]|nr:hypothetical protein [Dehalococcoidales bacterium]